jgi:hypothetical protein
MNRIGLLLVVFVMVACGGGVEDAIKEQAAKDKANAPVVSEKAAARELPPQKEKPPPEPEPTTPEEIDAARKKAMIDGRDKDVIRFCEMGKYEEKGDEQVMLGCTLAACRMLDEDKAKAWSKSVAKSKPLFEQAVKTCMANKVVL